MMKLLEGRRERTRWVAKTDPARPAEPVPVLKQGVIYSSDNGRMVCYRCAGMRAKFMGICADGTPTTAMTQEDAEEWERLFDRPMACEEGCTTYRRVKRV